MAESGKASLAEAFPKFASKNKGAEATSKDMTKWCQDSGVFGPKCSSNNMDIAFSKVKVKGKTTITMKELGCLIDELVKTYKLDKKCDDAAAKTQLEEKLGSASPKAHGATKQSKAGGVDRMTDASKYTGSHKERFDKDGKGKGKDGRADLHDNTGYVGNYKGSGTYEEKK